MLADREEVRQHRGGSRLAPVHGLLEAHTGTGEENGGEEPIPGESARPDGGVDQKWADKQRDIETFLNQHFPGRSEKKQTQGQLLQRVQEGTFFGALEVDIDTPPHLRASSGK